ncbi:MAG TPA: hypothetical protein VMH26_09715 [Burkholderiales bacterium]|nr:hypothetical protein [Burkholderiales bacterium]
MDTYILRIYRRSRSAPYGLHGTVERVGAKSRSAFASRDELWALLEAQVEEGRDEPSRERAPGDND